MKKEDFFEVLGELDDDLVKGAKKIMKKKWNWKVWGTMAACICVVVIGFLAVPYMNTNTPGEMNPPDSGTSGGSEGGMGPYSAAVYPPTESEDNVKDEVVVSLSESEMMQQPLAEHIPDRLPDGFHYGRGSHYKTTMKDGTQYNMLWIEYITGTIPEPQFTEDGGEIAPDPGVVGDQFLLMIRDHAPKKDGLYTPDDVNLSLLEEGSTLWIQYGDFYVGVSAETADTEAVLTALRSID